MEKFILKHQYIDDRTDEVPLENNVEFVANNLFDDFCSDGAIGILTRIEEFLKGSGFGIKGHLAIVEEEDNGNEIGGE